MTDKKNAGFSLIEMTIVLIIFSIMVAGAMNVLTAYELRTQSKEIKSKLDTIKAGLENYIERFGMLPCPASLVAIPGTKDFGKAMDCNTTAVKAGFCSKSGSYCIQKGRKIAPIGSKKSAEALRVRIGAVPARDINIPFEMTFDKWGSKILYAVTETLAQSPSQFNQTDGGISVIDESGVSVINPENTAAYILLSTGTNRMGAVPLNGEKLPKTCNDADKLEYENCDFQKPQEQSTFRAAFFSGGDSTLSFDDYIVYETKYANVVQDVESCKTKPLCSADNIDTVPVCRIADDSLPVPLCTHRHDLISGVKSSDEYAHDVTTWKNACELGSGWSIPSLAELRVMNKYAQDIGNFVSDKYYLSNSSYNPGLIENDDRKLVVWAKEFGAGQFNSSKEKQINLSPKSSDKGQTGYIRCVFK